MKIIKIYTIRFFLFLLFIAGTNEYTVAQTYFEGLISTLSKVSLPNVSICLVNKGTIRAYTISTPNGNYRLKVPEVYQIDSSYQLQFTCIGFQKKLVSIKTGTSVYDVQLLPVTTQLPDVQVKSTLKFVAKNDTLTYDVASFAQKQDRKIGDVIKNLPGIEMLENGRILYNGKAISNFYIDGDDLLGDRYNIASNTLPVDMVDKIQVLQNHQSIKALKDIKSSNDVALNVKLKSSAKLRLHGVGEAGAGTPSKYTAEVNTLGFYEKYKFINLIKANNTGTDIYADITQLNYKDYLKRIEMEETGRTLSPEINYLVPLNKNRYYNNSSLLASINSLFKIKKDAQLLTNFFYLPNQLKFNQQNNTAFFLQNDTIRYSENQNSKTTEGFLAGDVQLNINAASFYLNNKLTFQKEMSVINAEVNWPNGLISQHYNGKKLFFANDFSLLKVINKKHILDFFSYLSYTKYPEHIEWIPGLYPDILNDSIIYKRTSQNVEMPTFFTNNYFSYSKRFSKYFIQSYKAGIAYQRQNLTSEVDLLQQNDSIKNAGDSFANNFAWNKMKAYFILGNNFEWQNLKIDFRLPVNYQIIEAENLKSKKIYFNPAITGKFKIGLENSVNFGASVRNSFGNIQSLYKGYIITNYRSIIANDGLLAEQKYEDMNVGFNYTKSAKILFANISLGYNKIRFNYISANFVNAVFIKKILLPINNAQNNWYGNLGISKYLFKYGATVGVNLNYQRGTAVLLTNKELQHVKNNTLNLSMNISYKKSKWFNFTYRPSVFKTVVIPDNQIVHSSSAKQVVIQFQQKADCIFYPADFLQLKIAIEQFYNNNGINQIKTNSYFADCSILYNLKKLHSSIELRCDNILNNKVFVNTILFSNSILESQIALNPRMIIGKFSFSF